MPFLGGIGGDMEESGLLLGTGMNGNEGMKLFFCHACDGYQTLMPLLRAESPEVVGRRSPNAFVYGQKPWFPTSNEASLEGDKNTWATKNIRSHPMKYWLVNDRILYFIDIFHNFPLKKHGIGLFLTHTLYKSIQRMSIGIINILNVYQLQSSPHLQVLIEVNPTASTVCGSKWMGKTQQGKSQGVVFFCFLVPHWVSLVGRSCGRYYGSFKDVSTSIAFVSPKNGHKSA